LLCALDDVVVRKHFFDADQRPGRPEPILGRNLGRYKYFFLRALANFPYKPFAVTVTVRKSSVDEVQPEFDRSLEGCQGLVLCSSQPLFSPDTPSPVAGLTHLHTRRAEFPITHTYMIAAHRGRVS